MHSVKDNFRLAIVGCGQISDRYFTMVDSIDKVEIIATCARTHASAKAKGLKYGVTSHFDNYVKMMDCVDLDGVIVATPHSTHAEVCFTAFEHGLHVLNEKPMATTLGDCFKLVQMADDSGVVFMSLPYDYVSPIMTAHSLLKEEYIGKITGGESYLNIPGPPRDNWYYDKAIAHGGAMLDCMVYPVSRLINIIGQAKRVTGFANNLIPFRIVEEEKQVRSNVDDNVAFLLEFEHGQHAVLRSLWGTSFYEDSTTIYGRLGTIVLPGDWRTILQRRDGILDIPGSKEISWRGWHNCVEVPGVTDRENIVEHFVKCIREGKEPTCSGRRQLHVHEILFRGYESALEGKTFELQTGFTPWHDLDKNLFDTQSSFI